MTQVVYKFINPGLQIELSGPDGKPYWVVESGGPPASYILPIFVAQQSSYSCPE